MCRASRPSGLTARIEVRTWRIGARQWVAGIREVVGHVPGTRGFAVRPKRWIVERTFGWFSRNRRMSKDYERKVQTSETLIELAMIRLLLVRLGQHL
jgi:transposase